MERFYREYILLVISIHINYGGLRKGFLQKTKIIGVENMEEVEPSGKNPGEKREYRANYLPVEDNGKIAAHSNKNLQSPEPVTFCSIRYNSCCRSIIEPVRCCNRYFFLNLDDEGFPLWPLYKHWEECRLLEKSERMEFPFMNSKYKKS